MLHITSLPDFDTTLRQRDSELLLSYLTVPYLRIPLVLEFFTTEDRVHALKDATLQKLLNSVLFEPGKYMPTGEFLFKAVVEEEEEEEEEERRRRRRRK